MGGTQDHEKTKVVIDSSKDKDSNTITKKILVFASCFAGAVLLWFLSALNHNYTSYIKYPIKIVYDEKLYIPTQPLPTSLKINATGYGWDFLSKRLSVKKKPLLLKPTNLPQKKFYSSNELLFAFRNQVQNININFIVSDTLPISFDWLVTKTVVVKIDTSECEITKQLKLTTHLDAYPKTIVLTGPKSVLAQTRDTLNINLSKKTLEEGYSEKIEIKEFEGKNISTDIDKIEVQLLNKL